MNRFNTAINTTQRDLQIQHNSNQNPNDTFIAEVTNLHSKLNMNLKGPQIARTILEKRIKVGELPDFNT
jgi:hypothetical protein